MFLLDQGVTYTKIQNNKKGMCKTCANMGQTVQKHCGQCNWTFGQYNIWTIDNGASSSPKYTVLLLGRLSQSVLAISLLKLWTKTKNHPLFFKQSYNIDY